MANRIDVSKLVGLSEAQALAINGGSGDASEEGGQGPVLGPCTGPLPKDYPQWDRLWEIVRTLPKQPLDPKSTPTTY
jgi:hypothetical protein